MIKRGFSSLGSHTYGFEAWSAKRASVAGALLVADGLQRERLPAEMSGPRRSDPPKLKPCQVTDPTERLPWTDGSVEASKGLKKKQKATFCAMLCVSVVGTIPLSVRYEAESSVSYVQSYGSAFKDGHRILDNDHITAPPN